MHQKEKFLRFVENLCNDRNLGNINNKVFLDFRSGAGKLTKLFVDMGINCYGIDFYPKERFIEKSAFEEKYNEKSSIKGKKFIPDFCYNVLTEDNQYKIPFESNYFDILFSNNVFEHVMNYDETLAEMSRVTKKNGISIHFFPSKYRFMESHVLIPGATVFQNIHYLRLMTWYSRKKYKGPDFDHLSNKELAFKHYNKLKNGCNYLDGKTILNKARKNFSTAYFADEEFFKLWPGNIRKLYKIGRVMPFIFKLHSIFRMKILFMQK